MVDNTIVLASPVEVGRYLLAHLPDPLFYHSIGRSLCRIMGGFSLALLAGMVLAVLVCRFSWVGEIVEPLMAVIKAAPVAALTVLLLLWAGAQQLSAVLCFLIVLPNVYEQMLAGLRHIDRSLLDLADCYRLPLFKRLLTIYRCGTAPYLYGCLKVCTGLSFKSAVAAEIIAVPLTTMGERLYFAKIHLDTPGVFAWTTVVVVLSFVTEKVLLMLFRIWMNGSSDRLTGVSRKRNTSGSPKQDMDPVICGICLHDIEKVYDNRPLFESVCRTITQGECQVIVGRSGVGKTTLLHILAGLLPPDTGSLSMQTEAEKEIQNRGIRIGMVFQDEVVLPSYTAQQNIEIFAGRQLTEEEEKDLCSLLPEDAWMKKAGELSGGMKRRVQIARAMFAGSSLLVMDEPFRGLDQETKSACIAFIQKYRKGRILLLSTHDEKDADYLGGVLWRIGSHSSD